VEAPKQAPQQTSPRREAAGPAPAQAPLVAFKLNADQVAKIRSELDVVESNMKVMNEMLAELTPGEEHPEDAQLLQDLNETCRAMQQRVVALISQINNDELTADLLRINDELNALFLKYGKYQRARSAKDKDKGAQSSPKKGQDALIDFDDGGVASGVGAMSEFQLFANWIV
jgi:hypothetical protein